ncbi:MAG: TRAP transporter small permease subunit [Paracoccus sp. (in: a-proteobacteria)]|nr:TRAP transporter small permease subunit [Paracoccus sp. (in: a-proteobacteria)]
MTGLLALTRVIDRMNSLIGRSVAWLILLAVLVSAGNAVVRKLFNISSNMWLELQWYLYGAAFMLAAAYTLLEKEHIRIDIIYGGLSRRTQLRIDMFGHLLLMMPFVILMCWKLWPWFMQSYRSGEISTNAGGLILWPGKIMLVIGFLLLALQGLSEIIKTWAILRGDLPDDGYQETEMLHAAEASGHPELFDVTKEPRK